MSLLVSEQKRNIPVTYEGDVIVCGSGPAGITAALAAAKAGSRVGLIEVSGCLGGVWTAGLLTYVLDPKQESPVTSRILRELEKHGATLDRSIGQREDLYGWAKNSFIYEPEAMKLVLEELCLEAGIEVQLHTRVCAALPLEEDPSKIDAIVTESKSGRQAWRGKIFIDATGDGDLAAQAGCQFSVGRPGSGETQPLTLLCVISSPNPEGLREFCFGQKGSLHRELRERNVKLSYGGPILFHLGAGLFAFMMNHHYGSGLDARAVTRATLAARAEIHRVMKELAQQGGVWKGVRVAATAEQIGIREGRRIRGRYEVTVRDLLAGTKHEDGICRVHFHADVHSTNAAGNESFDPETHELKNQPYDIPLRALIAADRDNLLMAGRCISGDFLAHASYRVTGNAVLMGEAAGCLAATAVRHGAAPHEVSWQDFCASRDQMSEGMTGA